MPTKILPSNKSSRRRLNTGSALNSRQEATPASAEVGPSTFSTPSVSLRGYAESAEVSSSLSGQTIMDTHGSFVLSQSSLVEPRINKRRDHSPSETSDGRADTSRGNPSSDRGNPSTDRGNPPTIRGNPSNNNRGNPSDQESPVDFLDSTFTASADHSMSLKDITRPRSSHQVVYHKGRPTSNAILLYHDTKRDVVQQCIASLMSQFHDHYEHVEVIADSYKGIFEDKLIALYPHDASKRLWCENWRRHTLAETYLHRAFEAHIPSNHKFRQQDFSCDDQRSQIRFRFG